MVRNNKMKTFNPNFIKGYWTTKDNWHNFVLAWNTDIEDVYLFDVLDWITDNYNSYSLGVQSVRGDGDCMMIVSFPSRETETLKKDGWLNK